MQGKKMKRQNRLKIGLLLDHAISRYNEELIRGAIQAADVCGFELFLFSASLMKPAPGQPQGYSESLRNILYGYGAGMHMDVFVVAYDGLRQNLPERQFREITHMLDSLPCILLECEVPEKRCIRLSQETAMQELMRDLIVAHGYKRIACIRGPLGIESADLRWRIYREEMEKNQLPCPEGYTRIGSFHKKAGFLIRDLLEAHPEIEAVVCANDLVAIGACEALRDMGLRPGVDIGIVGFDNIEDASRNDPPITTASANVWSLGYEAVMEAGRLAAGEKQQVFEVCAKIVIRASCGPFDPEVTAETGPLRLDTFFPLTEESLTAAAEAIFRYAHGWSVTEVPDSKVRAAIRAELVYLNQCSRDPVCGKEYKSGQREILNQIHKERISVNLILEGINQFAALLAEDIRDPWKLAQFEKVRHDVMVGLFQWRENVWTEEIEELSQYIFRAISIPDAALFGTRSLDSAIPMIGKELETLGTENGAIWLFPHAMDVQDEDGRFIISGQVTEALCIRDGVCVLPEERRTVSLADALEKFCPALSDRKTQMVFVLQHEESQFGLMICDCRPGTFIPFYMAAYQIGNTLKLLQMEEEHRILEEKLKQAVQKVKKENEVLEGMSLHDPLTQAYNRRGLLRSMHQMIEANHGENGILIFLDLNNLKEINDQFGHSAGDYAIRSMTEIMKKTLRGGDVIGRFGGDEFIALIIDRQGGKEELIRTRLKNSFDRFNEFSTVPFYVEASIGYITFVCGKEQNLEDLMDNADSVLYEDKKHKRKSVRKENFNGTGGNLGRRQDDKLLQPRS